MTEVEMTARDKMLQRVLNLRAKAADDAASENEVMSALAVAEKLMNAYQIEEAELSIAEATGRIKIEVVHKTADVTCTKGEGGRNSQKHKIVLVLSAINSFANVRSVMKHNGQIEFTGDRADVEIANYLTALIKRALDDSYNNYRKANPQVGYGAKTSFQNAMASRISTRLYDIVRERNAEMKKNAEEAKAKMIENQSTASSTALVIVDMLNEKREKVESEFRIRNPRLGTYRASTRSTNGNAFSAGRAAGDRVNLGRSVGANKTKAIA